MIDYPPDQSLKPRPVGRFRIGIDIMSPPWLSWSLGSPERFDFMIPIKIQCGCGQRYSFDVEPVHGRMTTPVACPICGVDGTNAANEKIAQTLAAQPAAPPPPARITRLRPAAPPAHAEAIARPLAPPMSEASPKASGEFNLGLGVLGAFIGALIGVGAMFGFYEWAGFRFPLLGVGIGILTGFGAKLLYKGTDSTLGIISGVIALVAVVGTLYLMYGTFPVISIISVAVSVSMAYRISSG
jgi:hypothetical protein